MVSPLDKEGGDAALWKGRNAHFPRAFELHQSAPSGERFTYSSGYAFADPASAPYISQYLAERGSGGWASEAIAPPRSEPPVSTNLFFANEFQGFSEDLCTAWVRNNSVAPLSEDAIAHYTNIYRRENCAEPPAYEALTTAEPANRTPEDYTQLYTRGFAEDGTHSIFEANDKLHADAPELADKFELLLYEHTGGELRFVCYLPDGTPSPLACSAGTSGASKDNAISADGERIFWTAYSGLCISIEFLPISQAETEL